MIPCYGVWAIRKRLEKDLNPDEIAPGTTIVQAFWIAVKGRVDGTDRATHYCVVRCGVLQAWWKLCRGKVQRWWKRTKDRMPRHWQPKSPADCPRCQGGEEIEEVVLPVERRSYAERKSQRGRKKQLDTHGWACPNEGCDLFGETDAKRHALVGVLPKNSVEP